MARQVDGFYNKIDTGTEQPIIQPLKCMQEVDDWNPGLDLICTASVELNLGAGVGLPSRPRTLVCHDMKGGYLEDRLVQGVTTTDCYRFYNWSSVDVFVYFSHNFVTIPPPCWTNAGHRNGVPVLGTLITEWLPGKEICDTFLRTSSTRKNLVDKLVSIAQYYRFDGWLVNIENEICEEDIPKLVSFVEELNEAMKLALPFSLVLWYDSVIMSGKLEWQNELNEKNRAFFDACGGIFLNYVWKDGNLERSKEAARDRLYDVYVGVDVFGRGCKGGGGFNTIEAIQDSRRFELSVAIFGQGWAYEKFGNNDFLENEKRFWELVNAGCVTRKLTSLPLLSTFCPGWGYQFHSNGKSVESSPWTNMCLQSLQPIYPQSGVNYERESVFHGGGSMRFTCRETDKSIAEFKLFDTDIQISRGCDLYLSYTHKSRSRNAIRLELTPKSVLLISDESDQTLINMIDSENIVIPSWKGSEVNNLVESAQDHDGWCTSWFRWTPDEDHHMNSISLILQCGSPESPPNSVCIGSIRILPAKSLSTPNVLSLRALCVSCVPSLLPEEYYSLTTLTLSWNCEQNVDYFLVYYTEGDDWTYLGSASTTAFRVCKLKTKGASCRFKVQAVYCAGVCVPLETSPAVSVICEPKILTT